jgi:hypothetical protein
MKRMIFGILFLLMAQGCASAPIIKPGTSTEMSNMELHTVTRNGKTYLYKIVQRVYKRNGVSIAEEKRCFHGTDAGELVSGACNE